MSFRNVYRHSLFANMAYVDWDTFNTSSILDIGLAAQDALAVPISVVDAKLGIGAEVSWSIPSFHPSDETGFAANVFANGTEKVLAIRGTELDQTQRYLDAIQADLFELGLIGTSLSQAVSLFNYVERLRAPAGSMEVLQLALRITETPPAQLPSISSELFKGRDTLSDQQTVYYWFQPQYTGRGEGVLSPGDSVTVTGHSLGGHLAALALRLFPGLFEEAVVFNTANFDPITAQFIPGSVIGLLEGLAPNSPLKPFVAEGFDNAQQLTEPLVNELFAAFLPDTAPLASFGTAGDRLLSYLGEDSVPGDDLSLIAGSVTGRAPAPVRAVRTEVNSHSMDQVMDSLAVYALLERLDPALDARAVETLIDSAASEPARSLETLVGALDKLLHEDHEVLLPVAADAFGYPGEQDAPGTFERRAAIHTRILALEETLKALPGVTLESLAGVDAAELVARAETSDAVRYALLELNPFVLDGIPEIYGNDPRLARERFSADYLHDRAAYLAADVARRLADAATEVHGAVPFRVIDLARETALRVTTVEVNPLGVSIDRLPQRQIVFGTGQSDSHAGTDLRDHLYGESGHDMLHGQDGEDVLDGGAGNDQLRGGAGRDRLWGGDGSDSLVGGTTETPDDDAADLLQGGDGFDYYVAGRGDRIRDRDGDLSVVVAGQTLRASSRMLTPRFESASIGVYQAAQEPALWYVHTPVSRTLLVAGVAIEEFLDGDLGISLRGSADPDPARALQAGSPAGERLVGTVDPDLIQALGGDDLVYGEHGDDLIYGGDGDDRLAGDEGDDQLYGEAGRDVLLGGDDDDSLDGGDAEDVISGGHGNDVLLGGEEVSNDLLFGGSGHDVILGGAGRDFLSGSGIATGAADDWALEFLAHPIGGVVRDPRNVRLRGIAVSGTDELFAPAIPTRTCCTAKRATIICWAARATTGSMAAPVTT